MTTSPAQSQFSPRTAIVTGSDSGIGKATAVALAEAGLDIGITWHGDEEGAAATAEEVRSHGRNAVVARLDTTDLPRCGDVIDELARDLGGVDVFVNNAGTGDKAPVLELTFEQWRHTVAADLDGAFVCMQRAARQMVDAGRGGRIIAITSVHEHQPRVGSSAYDAAKHGLGGLVKTLALELGEHGITANVVMPPVTDTGWITDAVRDFVRTSREHVHVATPDDVAEVVRWLVSDAARLVTANRIVLR
jgi:NAD(P)-dependent dehydrogenase (short-subunit alcohol dehydrogenase family)